MQRRFKVQSNRVWIPVRMKTWPATRSATGPPSSPKDRMPESNAVRATVLPELLGNVVLLAGRLLNPRFLYTADHSSAFLFAAPVALQLPSHIMKTGLEGRFDLKKHCHQIFLRRSLSLFLPSGIGPLDITRLPANTRRSKQILSTPSLGNLLTSPPTTPK